MPCFGLRTATPMIHEMCLAFSITDTSYQEVQARRGYCKVNGQCCTSCPCTLYLVEASFCVFLCLSVLLSMVENVCYFAYLTACFRRAAEGVHGGVRTNTHPQHSSLHPSTPGLVFCASFRRSTCFKMTTGTKVRLKNPRFTCKRRGFLHLLLLCPCC